MGHFLTFVFAVMLLGVAVVVVIMVLLVRLLRGGSGASTHNEAGNEARLIQELYHGLNKMEERMEALETLLLDKEQKEGRQ